MISKNWNYLFSCWNILIRNEMVPFPSPIWAYQIQNNRQWQLRAADSEPPGKVVHKNTLFPSVLNTFLHPSSSYHAGTEDARPSLGLLTLESSSWQPVLAVGRAGSRGGQQNKVAKQPWVICLFCTGQSPGKPEPSAEKPSAWYRLWQGLRTLVCSRTVPNPALHSSSIPIPGKRPPNQEPVLLSA